MKICLMSESGTPNPKIPAGNDFAQLELAIAEVTAPSERHAKLELIAEHANPVAQPVGFDPFPEIDERSCAACGCHSMGRMQAGDGPHWTCSGCGWREVRSMPAIPADLTSVAQATGSTDNAETKPRKIQVFRLGEGGYGTEAHLAVCNDEQTNTRITTTLRGLRKTGTLRPLSALPTRWQTRLDGLREQFPNFVEVIDAVVEPSFAITAAGGIGRPAPLLLIGPPGIGKSFFSSELAAIRRTPIFRVDMASATFGAVLDGLATHWANSGPGEVFKTLAYGRVGVAGTADPVGLIDELDKVSDAHQYDPRAALYKLLEVESARNFEDQSLPGLGVDASHVTWICCANDHAPIPRPLLSRLHVVCVNAPTETETSLMFRTIFASVVDGIGIEGFEIGISNSIIRRAIDQFSVREFKTRSGLAVGRALAKGRRSVEAEDFAGSRPLLSRRIGF